MPHDDDRARSRYTRRKSSPLPPVIGLAAGGFLLLAGGGAAVYLLFITKDGDGAGLLGPSHTITYVNVRPREGPQLPGEGAGGVDVEVKFTGSTSGGDLFVVVQSHYARRTPGRAAKIPPEAAAKGRFFGRLPDGGLPSAPYDVWLERRVGDKAEKVSNTITEEDGWPTKK